MAYDDDYTQAPPIPTGGGGGRINQSVGPRAGGISQSVPQHAVAPMFNMQMLARWLARQRKQRQGFSTQPKDDDGQAPHGTGGQFMVGGETD